MNDLQLWGLLLKNSKDMTFDISELEMSTIQKVGRIMSLLVESSHMWIDSKTVHWSTGVGFRRRGLSFIFPCDLLYTTVFRESLVNLLP